jgi:hypothetical protein
LQQTAEENERGAGVVAVRNTERTRTKKEKERKSVSQRRQTDDKSELWTKCAVNKSRPTDRRTDGQKDRRTDGRTDGRRGPETEFITGDNVNEKIFQVGCNSTVPSRLSSIRPAYAKGRTVRTFVHKLTKRSFCFDFGYLVKELPWQHACPVFMQDDESGGLCSTYARSSSFCK